jgi:hypothetical protein
MDEQKQTEHPQEQPTQALPEVEPQLIADMTSGAFLDMWAVKIIDGKQFKIKIGLSTRAATPEAAFTKLIEAVKKLEVKYNSFTPYNPDEFRVVTNGNKATEPQKAPEAKTPAPAGAKAAPAPASATPAPATPATGGGAVEVNRVTVTPNAEGKVKIEFWKTGRKYAELYATWTPEYASEMFSKLDASWTVDKFAKAVVYDATFTAEFVYGRPNPKGTPYKDIIELRP